MYELLMENNDNSNILDMAFSLNQFSRNTKEYKYYCLLMCILNEPYSATYSKYYKLGTTKGACNKYFHR